jgi:hypothetical protein
MVVFTKRVVVAATAVMLVGCALMGTAESATTTTASAAASAAESGGVHPIFDKIHSQRRFVLFHSRSLQEGSCSK